MRKPTAADVRKQRKEHKGCGGRYASEVAEGPGFVRLACDACLGTRRFRLAPRRRPDPLEIGNILSIATKLSDICNDVTVDGSGERPAIIARMNIARKPTPEQLQRFLLNIRKRV